MGAHQIVHNYLRETYPDLDIKLTNWSTLKISKRDKHSHESLPPFLVVSWLTIGTQDDNVWVIQEYSTQVSPKSHYQLPPIADPTFFQEIDKILNHWQAKIK